MSSVVSISTQATQIVRLLSTNSTATSSLLTDETISATNPGTTAAPLIQVPQGMRGLTQVSFFGVGSNNNIVTYKVWAVNIIGHSAQYVAANPSAIPTIQFETRLLGSGTATLSSNIHGAAGGPLVASDYVADTLTWSPSAWCTNLAAVYPNSTPVAYSPADDATRAVLQFPDFFNNANLIIEVYVTGGSAATSANAMIQWST